MKQIIDNGVSNYTPLSNIILWKMSLYEEKF